MEIPSINSSAKYDLGGPYDSEQFKCREVLIEWVISKAKPFVEDLYKATGSTVGYTLSIDRAFGTPVITMITLSWYDIKTAQKWLKIEIEPICEDLSSELAAEIEAITPTSTRTPKELGEPSVIWKKIEKVR